MAHYVFPAATPAQPAAAYPVAQTAYVAAAPQTAYATAAPRAGQAYADSYQTHAAPQYAYTTRAQVAVTPTATYDQKTAYYQPAAQAAYTVPDTQYQTAKPAYTAAAAAAAAATFQTQRQVQQKATPAVQVPTTGGTYVYTAATSTPSVTTYAQPQASFVSTATTSSYSSYDAALYTAASNYYQQQQAGKAATTWGAKKTSTTLMSKLKPKIPPKPAQLHYCDVCKISCAGPQTYKEHLEGQKHKKKEAALKTENQAPPAGRAGHNQLRCELCDVTCTGTDAYAAHIRGSKHQKVLKLHTKLGKPIPSSDPIVVATAASTVSKTASSSNSKITTTAVTKTSTTVVTKKVLSTPKITFVGGTQLKSTTPGAKAEEIKQEPSESMDTDEKDDDDDDDGLNILGEKEVTPVGHEYIEEVKNETGKVVSFQCKLCDCKFNDPNAKEMHMKGRRHRLQYKKKVDPTLQVDVKPSLRARKIQEEKLRRQTQKEEFWKQQQEQRWRQDMRMEEEARRYQEMAYYDWQRMPGPRPGQMMLRKPDSSDDRHIMAKHAQIYPTEAELQAVQNVVSACEKALKLVSDYLAGLDAPIKTAEELKAEAEKQNDKNSAPRMLKGVMRVGVLAKGLLLHDDLNVQLVVLCCDKPTRSTLMRLADNLPQQLSTITDTKYDVKMCVEEASLIVTGMEEPTTTCTVTLTSPIMRDPNDLEPGENQTVTKDPPDVLDRQKCLDALAALRHAKWFQARAAQLPSCVLIIRILRDLCQRVPTWTPISQWAMELLVQKCVSSAQPHGSPGDCLRRIFECISSGILLPGGPGIHDPCEKELMDSASTLSNQQREDITASAQHALRLISFRQIHRVLGMDALPAPKFRRFQNPRKRRMSGEAQDDVAGEKKDKKETE